MSKKLLYSFILLLFTISISGQNIQLSDSAKVSLLTNTPWDQEVYALFGHTAIRIEDPQNSLDVVFNYGIFDFDSPNFMYRFVKGETDYMVAGYPFSQYLSSYKSRGIGITEQVLNLNQNEKQNIFDALVINALPENRIYRYNYFYDNCSTRPRDIIESNIDGKVRYYPREIKRIESYRYFVHNCVSAQPWVKFGIDLVIGADADKDLTEKQKDFLPANLLRSYKEAIIEGDSIRQRQLVSEERRLSEQVSTTQSKESGFLSPLVVGCILLVISILISYTQIRKSSDLLPRIFDFLLFFTAGLAGSIIFFLMFFSVHPCTSPNWNLVWLNPIQVIAAIFFLIKYSSKYVYYYHFINFAVLILFLLAWFLIPQRLEIAFLPYVLALCVRSGVIAKRKKHLIY
ncbi:lipoprotein N-acyltransferase Lnb domain-containing protein [Dysgonomonas macrotermitis]|nr:DUF4105 domain-containing protein [Dysgonomonas macrotermitis]